VQLLIPGGGRGYSEFAETATELVNANCDVDVLVCVYSDGDGNLADDGSPLAVAARLTVGRRRTRLRRGRMAKLL
jgi:hypothetical protein